MPAWGQGGRRRLRRPVLFAVGASALLWLAPAALAQVSFSGPTNFPAGGPGGGFRGPSPVSVAIGDFNGDADPDLAVADSATDHVSVLLGAAGAGFGERTNYPVGVVLGPSPQHAPHSVAVGDFNGDSDPDLAVANVFSNSVSALLGGPGGSFGEATAFPAGRGPEAVAVADFNGDADPDLAVADSSAREISVLLGGAGGGFAPATTVPVSGFPQSVAIGDFNGDADPDLAVGASVAGSVDNVSVLLGRAGGAFEAAGDFPVGDLPHSLAIGDFNGDSHPDLAAANFDSDNVSVLLGAAGGGFGPATNVPAGRTPRSIAVSDLNGDSDPDLAVVNSSSNKVSVLLGGAGGSFGPPTSFAAGSFPAWVAVGDFNADAHPDLVAANSASSDVSVLVNTTSFPPRAADDSYRGLQGRDLAVAAPGVLANDSAGGRQPRRGPRVERGARDPRTEPERRLSLSAGAELHRRGLLRLSRHRRQDDLPAGTGQAVRRAGVQPTRAAAS